MHNHLVVRGKKVWKPCEGGGGELDSRVEERHQKVWWQCEMPPMGSCGRTLGSWLWVLFGDVMKPLGDGGTLLEEVAPWEWALLFDCTALLPAPSLLSDCYTI